MDRPQALSVTTVLMIICNLMVFSIVDPTYMAYRDMLIIYLIMAFGVAIGFIFIWFYWKGRNWARRFVLIVSVLSLYNLRTWDAANHSRIFLPIATHVMLASRALVGAILLYFLNTSSFRSFFTKQKIEDGTISLGLRADSDQPPQNHPIQLTLQMQDRQPMQDDSISDSRRQ